jgi:hypothetical protein
MVRNAQLEADAKRIRLRATRRIGEIIGVNGSLAVVRDGNRKKPNPAAATLSLGARRSARSIARIPDSVFEKILESDSPPAVSTLGNAFVAVNGDKGLKREIARETERYARKSSHIKAGIRRRRSGIQEKYGTHPILDYLINRQPVRNLEWGEVRAWATKYLRLSKAMLLLGERFDDQQRVGDCVDEADADRALEATRP